jgi:hypothetical protein
MSQDAIVPKVSRENASGPECGHGEAVVLADRRRTRHRSLPLFAPGSVAVAIEIVDIGPDHGDRARDVGRAVTAAAGTVDIAGDRHAGA